MGAKGYSQLSAEGEEFPPPEWRPEKVSLCSRLVFHWVTPLILLGKNRQINQGDLPPLAAGKLHGQDLEIKPLVERFVEIREKAPREALFVPLLKVFKANIVLAWFFAVSEQACNLANPVLLRWFLSTFNEPTELSSESSGYELGVVMLLVSMLQTFLGNHGFLIISTLGVKQRAVIMTLLYRKALRLSNEARQESSVGQIVNLMSNDANRFPEFSMFVIRIWMVPIYLLVALLQLFSLLGAPALAGVIVLILGGWVNAQVMKRLHKLRTTQLNATDDRVMQTNEAILGIRIVKMNCWEEPIEKRIDECVHHSRELLSPSDVALAPLIYREMVTAARAGSDKGSCRSSKRRSDLSRATVSHSSRFQSLPLYLRLCRILCSVRSPCEAHLRSPKLLSFDRLSRLRSQCLDDDNWMFVARLTVDRRPDDGRKGLYVHGTIQHHADVPSGAATCSRDTYSGGCRTAPTECVPGQVGAGQRSN